MTVAKLVELPRPVANPDAVRMLEHWLDEAKAGRLQACALAGLQDDGYSITGCSGTENSRGDLSIFALLGVIDLVRHRILSGIVDKG